VADTAVVEVLINGHPPAERKPCTHRTFGVDSVCGLIEDGEGNIDKREVRIRIRCMECGVPCEVEPCGRIPRDGSLGAVLSFSPMED
jgi:hypothetical protein